LDTYKDNPYNCVTIQDFVAPYDEQKPPICFDN